MRHTIPALSGAAFLLISCGGGDSVSPPPPPPPPPAVATVTVEPGAPSVPAGGTVQLTATARDAAGSTLGGRTISWSSLNEPVATVSSGGLVTAITAGTAEIRATSEGRTGSANVTVTPVPVATVTLSTTQGMLVRGETLALVATAKDAAGNPLAGRAVAWSTSAAEAATVSNAGLVTAVGIGAATITATTEGKSATATITILDGGVVQAGGGEVTAAGGNVTITVPAGALTTPTAITVVSIDAPPAGGSLIAATAYDLGPEGTGFAQPVTLRIRYAAANVPADDDPSLFRIFWFDNGEWSPLPGSTVDVATRTVTATTTHFSGYAVGRMPGPVNTVTVTPELTLHVGATGQLTATLKDLQGNVLTGRVVTWTSLTTSVATVSETGLVEAVAPGTATIRATSEGRTGEVTVTVVAPGGFTLAQLATSGGHTCGLSPAGEAWCWGRNSSGELGDRSTQARLRPVRVAGNHTFAAISPGGTHTCALDTTGKAWCWGNNTFGSLGRGGNIASNEPVAVQTPQSFVRISSGGWHTCAITASGEAWCWGLGTTGALGDGETVNRPTPVLALASARFTQISAGTYHTCGLIESGAAWCWGDNGNFTLAGVTVAPGILGVGTLAPTVPLPTAVVGPIMQWAEVSAALGFTCARTPSGQVRCWGVNTYKNLGDGTTQIRTQPTPISTGIPFSSLAAGGFHACAVSMIEEVWCWGRNTLAQLGDGSHTDSGLPVLVQGSGGIRFTKLSVGASTSCGRSVTAEPWCWGHNLTGAIGDGTVVERSAPTRASP